MHTFQIANTVLTNYVNDKLTQERIDSLIAQASEQLTEIAKNEKIYSDFLKKVNAPKDIDTTILWILLMSNESICESYIEEYDKNFREIIPISDLADLLIHTVHLKKVQNIELKGFEYLLNYKSEGVDEVDQYAFTNALLYIQKSKEAEMEF